MDACVLSNESASMVCRRAKKATKYYAADITLHAVGREPSVNGEWLSLVT
jgi:hypothetical protein